MREVEVCGRGGGGECGGRVGGVWGWRCVREVEVCGRVEVCERGWRCVKGWRCVGEVEVCGRGGGV